MAHHSEEEEEAGLIQAVKEVVLTPVHVLLSPHARRAYLNSFLFFIAALILLVVAAIAYVIFYASFIPVRGFSRPVYLQFDPQRSHHPYGVVSIKNDLVSTQPYDVHVLLNLPRTPMNREAGNFMLDLRLHAPGTGAVGAAVMDAVMGDSSPQLLAHSRRPAILTYYSSVMEQMRKATQLPWYLIGWRKEAETIKVDMMEGVEFARGWRNIPATARLELRSDTKLQVYEATIVFIARFRGLRYLMYNYRIICFVIFTSLFWLAELASALGCWFVLSYFVFQSRSGAASALTDEPEERGRKPKLEDDEMTLKTEQQDEDATEGLSDTERSFPTYSRQPPLRYTASSVKKEEQPSPELAEVPAADAEADDEDEDADFVLEEASRFRGVHSDSGLGTSMESSANLRDSLRRRRSGGPGGGDGWPDQ